MTNLQENVGLAASPWKFMVSGTEILAHLTVSCEDTIFFVIEEGHGERFSAVAPSAGDTVSAEVATSSGLYAISAEFAGFGRDSIKVFLVKQPLDITHLQRRETERVSVLLDGVLTFRTAERAPARCGILVRDLSSSGARITLGTIPSGLTVGITVTLNFYHDSTGFVSVRGHVTRITKRSLGHEIGVAFEDSEPDVAKRVRVCLDALGRDRHLRRSST